jgi:N-acetylmuramoyl-L-alanine amidase
VIPRVAAALLACAAICPGAGKPVGLRTVRFYTSPQTTTVTVELDAPVTPRKGSVWNPPRVFFDLPDTRVLIPGRGTHVIPVGDGVVSQIRVAQYSPGVARVVLELEHEASVEVSVLADPVRLNFEVRPKIPKAPETAPKKQEPAAPPVSKARSEIKPPPAATKPEPSGPPRADVVLANPPVPELAHPKTEEGAASKDTRRGMATTKPAPQPAPQSTTAAVKKPPPGPTPESSTTEVVKKPTPGTTLETATTAAKKPPPRPTPESTTTEAVKKPAPGSAPESTTTATKKPASVAAPESTTAKVVKKPEPGPTPESTTAALRKPASVAAPESTTAEVVKKPEPGPTPDSTTAALRKPAPEPAPESTAAEGSKPVPAGRNSGGGRTLTRALGLKLARVVIDAGHGGHDEGTRGPTGLLEKDLVLDVAQRLGALIEEQMGAEVVYTRASNVFVPLEERTAIANRAEADLFLSLHANSSPYRSISGSEVYYLSFTTSKEALDVAARENASTGQSIHELEGLLKKIALSEKVTESSEFASRIQRELYGTWNKLSGTTRNRGVKKAPFVVLIGANMPSVLAEIGFISNPHDESLLKKPEQRQRIAEALFRGVNAYAATLSRMDTPATAKQASR